jgi:hypothetical protein
MKFNIRLLKEGDYEDTLVGWWKDWKWTAPVKEFLPNDGTGGFMVSKDGVDICAGFVYFTNSKLAWCEFIVSNINYKEEDRGEALEYLINSLCQSCKEEGYKSVWVCLTHNSLISKYENCGFIKASESCTEMIKFL